MTYKNVSRTLATTHGGSITDKYNGNFVAFDGGISHWQSKQSWSSPGPPYVDPNNVTLTTRSAKPARVSGDGVRYVFDDYAIGGYTTDGVWYPTPNWVELTNEALARTNPAKPIVDLPLFLFELRELPRALRDLGRQLDGAARSDPGGTYLSYQFGWAPLFSDLRTLLSLVKETEKRIKSLKEDARHQRSKGGLPGRSWTVSDKTYRWSYGGSGMYVRYRRTYEETNWYSTAYYVDPSDLPSLTDSGYERMQWALGLKVSASTVWNAIPWSWLIDYFSTIGSFMEANRGNIPWKAHNMCIMSKGTETLDISKKSSYGFLSPPSLSGGNVTFTAKRRKVIAHPTARIHFSPFLSNGQKANLLALASSRNSAFIRGG